MRRNEIRKQDCRVRSDTLIRSVGVVGIIMLLFAVFNNHASADESTSKNKGAEQSVVDGATTNATSGQEEVMLTERMKKKDFVCGTNGVCSKSSITIKDLKAILGVADLKKMKRAPSSSAGSAVYIFKAKGVHCIIRTSDPDAVMSDDSTVVSVTVNTKTKDVKDDNHLQRKLTAAQKEKEKDKK
jgi:hypothetical protein